MAVMEVNIVPLGTKTPSVSKFVVGALKVLRKEKSVKHTLTAMGTIVEGNSDVLLEIAGKMHKSAFGKGVKRVVTLIRIDERTDKKITARGKVKSVEEKLKL